MPSGQLWINYHRPGHLSVGNEDPWIVVTSTALFSGDFRAYVLRRLFFSSCMEAHVPLVGLECSKHLRS